MQIRICNKVSDVSSMEMYFHQPNHIYYETRAVVNICKNLILHVITFLPNIRISATEPKR